jgi:hypothetical protein
MMVNILEGVVKKIYSVGLLIIAVFLVCSARAEEFYSRDICSFDFYVENKFHYCEKMCEFKFNAKKQYSFCGENINKIAFSIELGSYYKLSHHLPLVIKSIRSSLEKIDGEVGEYKYKIVNLPLGNRDAPSDADYFFYIYIENPNFDDGTVRFNLFKSMKGKFHFGYDYLPINKADFEGLFVKNINVISGEINLELFYKKDDVL